MYSAVDQNKLEIAKRVLSLFENSEAFHPLLWGDTESLKLEYNREEVLERLEKGLSSNIYIYGDKKSKLNGEFDFSFNIRSTFSVSVEKAFSSKSGMIFLNYQMN